MLFSVRTCFVTPLFFRFITRKIHQMKTFFAALAATLFAVSCGVQANPDEIKKELAKRFPDLKTERVTKTSYGNLYEVFTGTEIFYTDEKASFVFAGSLIDTATRSNVTEARLGKLTAINFDELPFENAIKMVRGNGQRRMAIFEDPLCGYCKKFEADVNTLDNVTVYTFLYPILAQDSHVKSKAIWCAKDKLQAWQDWMIRDKLPPPAEASCETPIEQNVQLGQRLRVNGIPATFFIDGERISGALPIANIEAKLAAAKKPAEARSIKPAETSPKPAK
jgi:thiol:disulfide interchange protein DsbC